MIEFLFKLIKFGLVGVLGLLYDFGLTYLFKEKVKINKYIANAIGFSFAATQNFFLNKFWTFQDKSTLVVDQFFLFIFIAVVGLGLNQLIIYIIHDRFMYNFYVAKVVATIIVFLWNFILNYLLTFNQY